MFSCLMMSCLFVFKLRFHQNKLCLKFIHVLNITHLSFSHLFCLLSFGPTSRPVLEAQIRPIQLANQSAHTSNQAWPRGPITQAIRAGPTGLLGLAQLPASPLHWHAPAVQPAWTPPACLWLSSSRLDQGLAITPFSWVSTSTRTKNSSNTASPKTFGSMWIKCLLLMFM